MVLLYPNIIYHPDTGTEVFIDSLQRVDHAADAEVVSYRSTVDGSLRSFTRDVGARQMSLSCKIRQENEQTMRRLLNYLRGEKVYLMLGAEEMATVGRIQSFSIPKAVGTYTPLSIEFTCDTDLEGQFWEAEDTINTGSHTHITDSTASMGNSVTFSAQDDDLKRVFAQSDIVLPVGNYVMIVRMKDANQVTNDARLRVYNLTDSTYPAVAYHTLTSSYAWYSMPFSIAAGDAGNNITFRVSKDTTTTNTIEVDCFGFVRV